MNDRDEYVEKLKAQLDQWERQTTMWETAARRNLRSPNLRSPHSIRRTPLICAGRGGDRPDLRPRNL